MANTVGARNVVKRNAYFDSVVLMSIAGRLARLPGIESASLMMATPANKDLLREAGLLGAEGEAAGPNDLVVAIRGTEESAPDAFAAAEEALGESRPAVASVEASRPRSLFEAAAAGRPNLALISTPGAYAAGEALKALKLGMHVFCFSDNVSVEQEVMLKHEAGRRGLLVMGPDCGTAIVNGVPLGFANEVRRGDIGLIGASGTGLQMVSCLVDRAGAGVSHMLGVGGRDLSEQVGGLSMLAALEALATDPGTRVIVLVSKPPAPAVAQRVLAAAAACGKPVLVNFISAAVEAAGFEVAATLEEAAARAVQLSSGRLPPMSEEPPPPPPAGPRRFIRGLYSGGTFAYEARALLSRLGGGVADHVGYSPGRPLALPDGHIVIDLGEDEFTVGRPHPMIDPSLRLEFLQAAGRDPSTAVVLLDVVIGHGAASDPAGALAPAIAKATSQPAPALVVAFVCGTDRDPQGRTAQEQRLAEAGALVVPSSTAAARVALEVAEAAKVR